METFSELKIVRYDWEIIESISYDDKEKINWGWEADSKS